MTGKIFRLFCLVDGEDTPFSVKMHANENDTVDDLKVAIKLKKAPRFEDIASSELKLWNVLIPFNSRDVSSLPKDDNSKLKANEKLFSVFGTEKDEDNIRVFVWRPPRVCAIIKEIVSRFSDAPATVPGDIMPLKDRDLMHAVALITANVKFRHEGNDSKSNFHMIVSGGAPGIGYYAEKYGAEKYDCGIYKWKLCRHFLELLEDTGGLPRALELLFGQCFLFGGGGDGFFRNINHQNFDTIFTRVKDGLETRYKIYGAVEAKKKLALTLLHTSIVGRPVERGTLMDPDDKDSTIARLEQDAHIILEACNSPGNRFTIKMPLFFVCLYNDILHVVDFGIQERLRVQSEMHLQDWEMFVAYFQVFRNNLLIDLGHQTANLSELYPSAFGTPNTLNLEVKLERLSVRQAKEQFPSRTLNDRTTAEAIEYGKFGKNATVNGKSAACGDAFVVRETTQGDKIINIHQDKFEYNSAEFTPDHLSDEHQKNLDGSNSAKLNPTLRKTLASYQHITIIFTAQPFVSEVRQDDKLVISMDNFKGYFGPVFASYANFALTQINPNFSEQARMKEYIPGIGDFNAALVVQKRPFTSLDDFYEKIPRAKIGIKKYEDAHPGKKIKLNFYPFK
ncbi:hypothetical protein BGZ83_005162 [Gryganskiella cystojenkinii]|nr:hypothetical protein BGZ83_005162 [Gryganskiella cystojenkinii]